MSLILIIIFALKFFKNILFTQVRTEHGGQLGQGGGEGPRPRCSQAGDRGRGREIAIFINVYFGVIKKF